MKRWWLNRKLRRARRAWRQHDHEDCFRFLGPCSLCQRVMMIVAEMRSRGMHL